MLDRPLPTSLRLAAGLTLAVLFAGAEAGGTDERPRVYRDAEAGPRVNAVRLSVDLRDLPLTPEWQPGDPIKEIPRRHTHPRPPIQTTTEAAEDPLLAVQDAAVAVPDAAFTSPLLSFAGQGFTGVNPPDTVGDVGPTDYIQLINHNSGTSVAVYSKTGSLVAGPFLLESLGSGGACADGLGDPVVLYDPLADRWLLSEFSGTGNNLCVYISQTSDPVSGGWFRYQFPTPSFPDYPKYGVWPDAYYVSTNENSPAVYAFERARMLQGLSAASQRKTAPSLAGFPFQALTPPDLDGSNPPPAGAPAPFMRHRDDEVHNAPGTPDDFLEIWNFHVDWATPANTTFTGPINIAVAQFDSSLCGLSSFSCIPQPSGANALDPLREVVMFRLQYRNFGTHQALVGNLATDVNGNDRAGIRWFELRNTGSAWTLFQEGTYSPDTVNRWMGSAAMDGAGNLAVGYSVSSSSVSPGIRYAGRLSTDPAGTLAQGEGTLVNGSASNASIRWGDYSALTVDPCDDCSFWFTNEYSPASTWGTWIGSFKFDACTAPASPDFSIAAAPSTLVVTRGSSGTATMTLGSLAGFNSAVTLSATGLPDGVGATFSSNPVTPPGCASAGSTLTLSTASDAEVGTFVITVTGTSGVLTHSTNVNLTVQVGAPVTATFTSEAARDGRITESDETSGVGKKTNSDDADGAALRVGDDGKDKQLRSILSFDTSAIPDAATITGATLRLRRGDGEGENPFDTHGACLVDIRTGFFGDAVGLAAADFQAAATAPGVGALSKAKKNKDWSEASLDAAGLAAISRTGTTQFRIYFSLDDDDDRSGDFVGYLSGEAKAERRPQLVVTYVQ